MLPKLKNQTKASKEREPTNLFFKKDKRRSLGFFFFFLFPFLSIIVSLGVFFRERKMLRKV